MSNFNGLIALGPITTFVSTRISSWRGLRAIWAGKIWISSQCGKSLRGTPIEPISPWWPTLESPFFASSWIRTTVGSSGVGDATGISVFIVGVWSPILRLPKPACAPSQKGAFALALHWHSAFEPVSSTENFIGEMSVPIWDPSQNGCFCDFPQRHQK